MLNAIIMASGLSQRMGQDKLLLPFKNKTIIEHTLDIVIQCNLNHIVLVGKNPKILQIGKTKGINVVFNSHAEKGQSESIKLGVKKSPKGIGYVFFTGDQPLMDVQSLERLINRFTNSPESIIIPTYQNRKGSPVFFPYRFRNDFLSLTGDVGGKEIIKKNNKIVEYVNIDNPYFLWDIDTDEDYQKLLKRDEL